MVINKGSDAGHINNLTHIDQLVKYIILACITTDWDIVMNTNVFLQYFDKTWLEQLDITIIEPFGDLTQK